MSVPQFARALETVPGSQSVRRSRCVSSTATLSTQLPAAPMAPLAIALIAELRRAAGPER